MGAVEICRGAYERGKFFVHPTSSERVLGTHADGTAFSAIDNTAFTFTASCNKGAHHMRAIPRSAAGATPKYSPDLSPIEMSFSKLKAYLRIERYLACGAASARSTVI